MRGAAEATDESTSMPDMDETFDLVVVGSGGGSMCAALRMRAAGKSVLIVEKTPLIGGTTARSTAGTVRVPPEEIMPSIAINRAMVLVEGTGKACRHHLSPRAVTVLPIPR